MSVLDIAVGLVASHPWEALTMLFFAAIALRGGLGDGSGSGSDGFDFGSGGDGGGD